MSNPEMRDVLLGQEQTSPELEARYREEIENMYEKKLSGIQRVPYVFFFLLGTFFLVFFGWVAMVLGGGLPLMARAMFGFGSLCGLIQMILYGKILWCGKVDFKWFEEALTQLMWVFMVVLATFTLLLSSQMEDQAKANHMLLYVLVFLVLFSPFMVRYLIRKSELAVREQMLRMEQRLMELGERLEGGGRD